MTLVLKSILAIFTASLIMLAASPVMAASPWLLKVSTPATKQSFSTFNLDYQILSTQESQNFKVELIEGSNNVVESQNVTTSKFGYNGRFSIQNVPEGTYIYYVKATDTGNPSDIQQSAPRNVTVDLPDTNVVVISSGSSSGSNASSTDTVIIADGEGNAAVASRSTDVSSPNGSEASSADSEDDLALLTETSSETSGTDVAAATDEGLSTANRVLLTVLVVSLVVTAGWFIFSRFNNGNKDIS